MPSHGFNQQEETVAEWLYNRIMLERHTFYEERDIEVIPWQDLDPGTVRFSYLKEARELLSVVVGKSPPVPRAVHDV